MRTIYKRPKYLSFLCVVGLIWSLLSFLYVFSPSVKKVGVMFPALLGILVASRFISMIGMWHMKKWGVLLFFTTVFLKIFLAVMLNQLSYVEVSLSVFVGFPLLIYFPRMDDNL